jgi:aspartyl-tRNA(Asn)/glutamyl-tRNA(Gln) amidotransferase subunit B
MKPLPGEWAAHQAVYDALPAGAQAEVDRAITQADGAMNYLVGQVMKKTQGRANPQVVRALLRARLDAPKESPAC